MATDSAEKAVNDCPVLVKSGRAPNVCVEFALTSMAVIRQ
jgi:hypothetical protein